MQKKMKTFLQFKLTLVSFFLSVVLQAQFTQEIKLSSDQREDRAEFGTSVAIRGEYALVGASRETIASGAAYLYRLIDEQWQLTQHITAPDAHEMAEFGGAVKLLENHAIIASGRADVNGIVRAGAIYVYDIDAQGNLVFSAKLVADDLTENGLLGMHFLSLDAQNNIIVAGAPGTNTWTGAVYVFSLINENWTQVQKIESPDAEQFEAFGISVSLKDDVLVVGASEADNRRGEALIFEKNALGEWEYTQTLTPSISNPDNFFGSSVSQNGVHISVGAYGGATSLGGTSVFIFEKNIAGVWEEIQVLQSPPSVEETYFGWDCKMVGDLLIVSSPHVWGFEPGEVFTYRYNQNGMWDETGSLNCLSPIEETFFGWSIATDGTQIIVGAPRDDLDNNDENPMLDAGSAFIFSENNLNLIDVNQFKVVIYPNPTNDYITVTDINSQFGEMRLYTNSGVLIFEKTVTASSEHFFSVVDLPTGVYFLALTSKEGSVVNKKIVKQ